ncbi:MAG TPA: PQQ-binding-like beta-propeller repeat protein, partial [Myxococcaceae bacterium]|nr:PQQ-binding-like beta-propeller repeat protein [Myxococcaceae bacterium]
MPPPAPADPPEPDRQPRGNAQSRLLTSPGFALLLVVVCPACSAPLLPVFAVSGDAPSRTGLTALGDGAVFGNDAGRVIRLDGTGRVLWTVETGAEIELPLVLTEDGVVGAVSGGDTLVALDADSGHERWRAGGQPPAAALAAV